MRVFILAPGSEGAPVALVSEEVITSHRLSRLSAVPEPVVAIGLYLTANRAPGLSQQETDNATALTWWNQVVYGVLLVEADERMLIVCVHCQLSTSIHPYRRLPSHT